MDRSIAELTQGRRILAVTSLDAAGDLAVATAGALVRAEGGALAVTHAIPHLETVRPLFPQRLAEDALATAMAPVEARQQLRRRLDALIGPDADVEGFVHWGNAAELALRVAEYWRADLIVVGPAEAGVVDVIRIVRHADVPVLVARADPGPGPVVAGTDFSDPALPAVHAAIAAARRDGTRACIVHVIEPSTYVVVGLEGAGIVTTAAWEKRRRDAAELRLREIAAAAGSDADYLAVGGYAVPGLAGVVADLQARLLVVGTVGRSGLTRFLLGSVAEALVRQGPCPVLVVRLHGERRAATTPPAR